MQFSRPFHAVRSSARDLYSIYQLGQPLAPGETVELTFNVSWTSHGFRDGNERAELAYNGTFFDSTYFPSLGYQQGNELDDPRRRREVKLGQLEEMAPRGDALEALYNLFSKDSDLDLLSHHCQHVRRSDRNRSRISQTTMARKRAQLLRVRHGLHQHCQLSRLPFGTL